MLVLATSAPEPSAAPAMSTLALVAVFCSAPVLRVNVYVVLAEDGFVIPELVNVAPLVLAGNEHDPGAPESARVTTRVVELPLPFAEQPLKPVPSVIVGLAATDAPDGLPERTAVIVSPAWSAPSLPFVN